MTTPAFDIQAAVAQAAQQTPSMQEAQKGGSYSPPAEGMCFVTLVGYIELGKQHVEASKQDPVKYPAHDEEQVQLVFELSGKGHEPKEVDGKKIPERLSVTLKKSLNEKAWFYRIFNTLNYDKQATHFAQLLGKHFRAKVVHTKAKNGTVYAGFKESAANGGAYTFAAPTYNPVDPETLIPDVTVTKIFPKPEVLTPLKLFLWDFPSKEMWASLYIEGKYDDRKDEKTGVVTPGRSKNVLQEKIRKAVNFAGSPLAELLVGEVDLGSLEAQPVPEVEDTPWQPTDDADAAAALAAL